MENNNIEIVVENSPEVEVQEDTMTVAEFVDLYEADKTKGKTEVIKKLKITPYINYEAKIALAENIVKNANVNAETGNVVLNSPLKFIFFAYTIVNKYTNVRMGVGDMFGDFNLLNSKGLIEYLMKQVPEKELSEFTAVVDMVNNDTIANKTEIHAFINDIISAFSTIVNNLGDIGEQFKDIDFDKLVDELKKVPVE